MNPLFFTVLPRVTPLTLPSPPKGGRGKWKDLALFPKGARKIGECLLALRCRIPVRVHLYGAIFQSPLTFTSPPKEGEEKKGVFIGLEMSYPCFGSYLLNNILIPLTFVLSPCQGERRGSAGEFLTFRTALDYDKGVTWVRTRRRFISPLTFVLSPWQGERRVWGQAQDINLAEYTIHNDISPFLFVIPGLTRNPGCSQNSGYPFSRV